MSSDWLWPAEGPLLTRFDPGPGMRHGIDIGGKPGTPVRAARAGIVLYSGSGLRGYGRLIIIRHDKKYITAYAHNAQLLVSEGARVKAGQVIARMGQSGNAGRVMLHFELREKGRPKDPLAYLPPRP
ncbi:murein hydrolase activator EnvC family protein [Thermithiobacillus plumbiphilus]|uniref:Peptidoglycan DD-metalloendopeptidase family protein n=1 Tax=Thermithiobacillus plumbiphilus TaxID=1729899 RepID=A0ABU9DDU7_9PROT